MVGFFRRSQELHVRNTRSARVRRDTTPNPKEIYYYWGGDSYCKCLNSVIYTKHTFSATKILQNNAIKISPIFNNPYLSDIYFIHETVSCFRPSDLRWARFIVPWLQYGPYLSNAVGPVDPSFLVVKKSHFNKNVHLTASLRTPQNRKYM